MFRGKVIVIGAGLSGLAAACYASINGYQVIVLEHGSRPGGAISTCIRNGFKVDPGQQFIWGHEAGTATHDLLRELGILPKLKVAPVPRLEVVDEVAGHRINLASSPEDLELAWKRISRQDSDVIEDLADAITAMDPVGLLDLQASKPLDMSDASSRWSSGLKRRKYTRYLRGGSEHTLSELAAECDHPFLQKVIACLSHPEAPAWLGVAMLSLSSQGKLGQLVQGSEGLLSPLVSRLVNLGGKIELNSRVSRILVQKSKVQGVLLANGKEVRADKVISAADGWETIFKMLEGQFLDEEIERRYREWKPSHPLVGVSIGTSIPFPEAPPMQRIILERPLAVGTSKPSALMAIYVSHGAHQIEGRALIQVALESDWYFWYKLRALDKGMYDEEKARVAQEVLSRLGPHFPGIGKNVELLEVVTPFTSWSATLNHEGSQGGWLPTPEAIKRAPRRALPGLEGFYMAGHWVVPGVGIATDLFSGKHAVQLMCHDQDVAFKATAPLIK